VSLGLESESIRCYLDMRIVEEIFTIEHIVLVDELSVIV
jgi:hypothetical protein